MTTLIPPSGSRRRRRLVALGAIPALTLSAAAVTPAAADDPPPLVPGYSSESFDILPIISTNNAPGIATGDLDGDGYPDAAIGQATYNVWDEELEEWVFVPGGLVVLRNDTNGGFEELVHYPGESLSNTAVADLDNDDDLDVVGTRRTGDQPQIALFENRGDGTFEPEVTQILGDFDARTGALATEDFNHDGNTDLVVATETGQPGADEPVGLAVLLGDGTGGFTIPDLPADLVQLGTSGDLTWQNVALNIDVADVDVDGELDLVMATWPEHVVTILHGDGQGGFGEREQLQVDLSVEELDGVRAVDLNNDGYTDIVANARFFPWGFNVFLNDGQGGFGEPATYPSSSSVMLITDIDVDGNPDIAFQAGEQVQASLNQGDGTFSEVDVDVAGERIPRKSFPAESGDFDLDGKADIILLVGIGRSDGLSLLTNTAAPAPEPPPPPAPAPEPPADSAPGPQPQFSEESHDIAEIQDWVPPDTIATSDLNGDGYPDAALGREEFFLDPNPGGLVVLLNDTAGSFEEMALYPGQSLRSVVTLDFDGDGDFDVVGSSGEWGAAQISLFENQGDGTFGDEVLLSLGDFQATVGTLATGDVDSDGNTDLLVELGRDGVAVLLGDGAGGFTVPNLPADAIDLGEGPYFDDIMIDNRAEVIQVADMDLDGNLDLVVDPDPADAVLILNGDGQGGFGTPRELPVPDSTDIDTGDLNGDGFPDVAAVNQNAQLVVYYSDGEGGFTVPAEYASATAVPGDVVITDLNGNGTLDVAVANGLVRKHDDGVIQGYLNLGNGALGAPISNLLAEPDPDSGVLTLEAGDFDLDGQSDLVFVTPNTETNGLTLLTNAGVAASE